MAERYTSQAKEAIHLAEKLAFEKNHIVGSEHLLVGLIQEGTGLAAKVLTKNGASAERLLRLMDELIAGNDAIALESKLEYSPAALEILENAYGEAKRYKAVLVGTEHILIAVFKKANCLANKLLNTINVSIQKVYTDMLEAMGNDATGTNVNHEDIHTEDAGETPTLDKYSRDLTKLAKSGKLDPVIGRDDEMNRVMQILSRRTKNNPCLIGEPGVGKTAVVEGLALKIAAGDVPETLSDKRLVTLDLSGMVAGSKYRGEFEERIKKVMAEVIEASNILLFIDEIHTIIGAGGAEGAIDASNILKPSLARGELQLIGATTLEEYRKYIEKDAALERRFQPIRVEEPSEEDAYQILLGLREAYESHHKLKISNEALLAAVKLSSRYIADRFLPDKAIDLVDEAASRIRLSNFVEPKEIKEIEEEIKELEKKKERYIEEEQYEEAGKIKEKQEKKRDKLEKIKEKWQREKQNKKLKVEEDDIADVVSVWTKIPVKRLEKEEGKRLKNLENILHERVIGQEEAVAAVAKAIRRGRVGLKDPKRPIGSFLFLGPTGVGKTELSKTLAEAMFGIETALIRVDMSEYMEKHSVSKMVGSPPGYVGYEEGGQLSEKIRRNPYSVILFDEIEKAHPDVFNILLQVLDDGHITDAQGRKIDFKNTIIIMTSNAGANRIVEPKQLGFASSNNTDKEYQDMKSGVMEEVKQMFKPEFLNRIDETIVFHQLTKQDMYSIIDILLKDISKRVKEQMDITLHISDTAKDFLIDKGYDKKYGARPLKRTLQNMLEDKLAEAILDESITQGSGVEIDMKDNDLVFL